jgi:EmrB/QacA subfamily drug resistance transporter
MSAGKSGVARAAEHTANGNSAQVTAYVSPAHAIANGHSALVTANASPALGTANASPAQATALANFAQVTANAAAAEMSDPRYAADSANAQDSSVPRRQGLRLALILLASFMVVLDFSIVNVALPSIERELGMTAAAVQWVITGYAIAFAGLLILGGRAADLLGRRRMFIVGLLAFTAASLSGGLAHDPVLLIASRVVQGAGAAVVAPAALSLITTSFADGRARTRALGLYGATASIGFVAGQVLGGILVQFTSWRAVFLVNVPIGLLAAALAPRLLADSRAPSAGRRLDAKGAVLITAAMAALVFAVSQAEVSGWLSAPILGVLAACAACIGAFVLVERRHPDPLLPAAIIRRPALRTATVLNVLLGLWNGGEMLVLSLYFQQVLRDSPLATGLAIAPQGLVGFVAGAFGARMASRIGIRRVLIVTAATAAAGFAILTRLPATGHYGPLLTAVMLVGFGTAGTAFGTMVIATAGIAGTEQGVVGGVINTSRQVGAALGAATLPAIGAAVSHDPVAATATGSRAAMLAAAIAAAVAALIAWRSSGAAPVPHATLKELGNLNRRDRHEIHHPRTHRSAGVPDRVRYLAARRRLGAYRRGGRDSGHPAGGRPGRDSVRHRSGIRLRRQ